jgi:xylulokinase
MNYLGIDIGTSGCKAVVFDKDGQQLADANREYDVIFSDNGGAELDSEEVMEKCFDVIKKCSNQVEPNSIVGMGISSQGEAFTVVGDNNEILCHGMISSDMRSESYVKPWTENFGEEKLYQITGHTAHPLFTIYKLLWFKDHKPEVWKKAKKFLCFEDLLQFKLGLDPAIGWSLAGRTMMFDVRKHEWNKDILNAVGLTTGQLARPLPSGSIAGKIDPGIAKKLGLADNAFVVTGGHDQPCGALGAGVTKAGMAMYATGTVECITAAFANPVFTNELRQNNLATYDHAVKDLYITVAYSLTGGNILKWYRDEFGRYEVEEAKKTGVNAYEILLNEMEDKPSNLLVLPYCTPSGTPYFDTKTKGAVLGLRLSSKRGEFIRALLEGVAFEMRLNMEILQESDYMINELRAIGGGARSKIWTKLKSDVTGKNITTLNVVEAGCLGVAMLACAAYTGKSVDDLAAKWIQPQSTVCPNNKTMKWYDERFKLYRKIYGSIKEIGV